MSIAENLAFVLSRFKEERGLSSEELAEQLKVSCSSLQNYLSGKGVPKRSTLIMLAQGLKMELGELLNGAIPQKTTGTTEQDLIIQQLMTNYAHQSESLLKTLRTLQDMLIENANCAGCPFCGRHNSPIGEDRT